MTTETRVTNPGFNPSQDPDIADIKEAGVNMQTVIEGCAPDSDRRRRALEHLEIALMLAVKAAAVDKI